MRLVGSFGTVKERGAKKVKETGNKKGGSFVSSIAFP
jgi:hypothetical protein